jgi:hypothetical protein
VTLAATVAIYAAQVDSTHLLDLTVFSLVAYMTFAVQLGRGAPFAIALLAIVTALGATQVYQQSRERDGVPLRSSHAEIVRELGDDLSSTLFENPLIPVLSGVRPILLDPWALLRLLEKDPGAREAFVRDVRDGHFRAIVLNYDANSDWGRDGYARYHFGNRFVEALNDGYLLAKKIGLYHIYRPRG